jgi:hypothetical protein
MFAAISMALFQTATATAAQTVPDWSPCTFGVLHMGVGFPPGDFLRLFVSLCSGNPWLGVP